MSQNLVLLRDRMTQFSIDGFLVGSADAHQSEYVCEADMRREFISGFNGSAGTGLILHSGAYLWTDGRYFLQAESQLSSEWTLMKSGEKGVLEMNDWILANMESNQIIGVDAALISTDQASSMNRVLNSKNIQLKPVSENPIDSIWNTQTRPTQPHGAIIALDVNTTGQSSTDKIAAVQRVLEEKGAAAYVASMLDEIAWLLNIRGADISYNPVVISYLVVTCTETFFFVDESKMPSTVKERFGEEIIIQPYDQVGAFLAEYAKSGKILADLSQLNWMLYGCIVGDQPVESRVISHSSPVALMKSLKNNVELEGIRHSHIRDGVALTAFFHWLETQVHARVKAQGNGKSLPPLTEADVVARVEDFRSAMDGHVGPSFSTIAAYGPNGAIIHYKPEKESAAEVGASSLFLMDSGAQYRDGTTDVTRTMHFGCSTEEPNGNVGPSQRMIDCFTLVLKGHVALARLVFPEGTTGARMDTMARAALWRHGLDYNHGTGHGVGAFLNVHEGPQGIGSRPRGLHEVGFFAGMTTSNEPGYYEDGEFGIRIENICITVEATTRNNFNGKKFLTFETVTMVPIQTDLINLELIDDTELEWVNNYNQSVLERIGPLMQEKFPQAMDYLKQKTSRLNRV